MSETEPSILVAGGLNTDIIGVGVPAIVGTGELAMGGRLKIAPGGKSRNMAQMMARLSDPGTVAMIGRTNKDPMGLWKVPYDALVQSGVSVDHVVVGEEPDLMPGVALIPVDTDGRNQIYVLPGANDLFSAADIENAAAAFEAAGRSGGVLALSLELPVATALAAVRKAVQCGMRVVLDPGGLPDLADAKVRAVHEELLRGGITLLKPNEHEARMYTGIEITDLHTAERAYRSFQAMGVDQLMITHGANGAYVFSGDDARHIPIPEVKTDSDVRDETGCGDQAMAVLCTELQRGSEIFRAAELAVLAGTLQFHRCGVSPLSAADLAAHR